MPTPLLEKIENESREAIANKVSQILAECFEVLYTHYPCSQATTMALEAYKETRRLLPVGDDGKRQDSYPAYQRTQGQTVTETEEN